MARYYFDKKHEADDLKKISVYFLKKYDYFEPGWHSGNLVWSRFGEKNGNISIQSDIRDEEQYVRLIYTQTDIYTGEKNECDYKIPLTVSPCNYGGERYWFVCPWYVDGMYCGRRVGVLYLGQKYFACRHCQNLTYNCKNLGGLSKIAGQVVSIPELEMLEREVKRKYYNGKITKKYERFLKKWEKADRQMMIMLGLYDRG